MFREMRRSDKAKSADEAVKILQGCTSGVLSVIGDDDYPYGVPVSYVYEDGKIIFHCASVGHKVDSIRRNPKVSFTVVGADKVSPANFTTVYKSVICFGKARIVDCDEEKKQILDSIIKKYSADYPKAGQEYIRKFWDATTTVVIDVEHMTAKGLAK